MVFKAIGVIVLAYLAIVGLAYLLDYLAGRRAFPRMDDRELDVLGCLWRLPRERGESHRRYRKRLRDHARGYPAD